MKKTSHSSTHSYHHSAHGFSAGYLQQPFLHCFQFEAASKQN
jgi:hypothetical protein